MILERSSLRITTTACAILALASTMCLAQERGARAFAIEAAASAAGSTAGMSFGLALSNRCGEDLLCGLTLGVGVGGVSSIVLAPAAAVIVGRAAHTLPSTRGAVIGSLIGSAAGFGALWLLDQQRSRRISRRAAMATYGIVHGVITAAGSRAGK